MKQTEKLDLILKHLYEFKFDGKYYSINAILENAGCRVSFDEALALAKRLSNAGYINIMQVKYNVSATITSEGAEYCEKDSYTYGGSAVIYNRYEMRIENSPGANLINQSSNITIDSRVNAIDDVLKKILSALDEDESIETLKKEDIKELIVEIRNNLNTGKVPKFGIQSLIALIGDISSMSGLVLTLKSMGIF